MDWYKNRDLKMPCFFMVKIGLVVETIKHKIISKGIKSISSISIEIIFTKYVEKYVNKYVEKYGKT